MPEYSSQHIQHNIPLVMSVEVDVTVWQEGTQACALRLLPMDPCHSQRTSPGWHAGGWEVTWYRHWSSQLRPCESACPSQSSSCPKTQEWAQPHPAELVRVSRASHLARRWTSKNKCWRLSLAVCVHCHTWWLWPQKNQCRFAIQMTDLSPSTSTSERCVLAKALSASFWAPVIFSTQ